MAALSLRLPARQAALVVLTSLALPLVAGTALAETPACRGSATCAGPACAGQVHSIWILSTRGQSFETPCPTVQRYDCGRWMRSSLEAFFAADEPGVPTIVLIHGAVTTTEVAHETLWAAVRQATYRTRPCRFVLWMWPSAPVRGERIIPQMRSQAYRSDCEAVALAQVMARMDPAVPVCLIGYSFGCRTALATMHLAGGGTTCGRAVEFPASDVRRRYRVALVGSASDNVGLLPSRRYGRALDAMESLLLFYNPKDLPLRLYRVLRLPGSRRPLGLDGPVGVAYLGANRCKIRMVNVTPYVRRGHQWSRYERSGAITRYVRPFANFVW